MSSLAMQRYYAAQGNAMLGAEPSAEPLTFNFLNATGGVAASGTAKDLGELDKALADAVKNKGAVSGTALSGTRPIRILQPGNPPTVLVDEAFPVGGGITGKLMANKGYIAACAAGGLGLIFLLTKLR